MKIAFNPSTVAALTTPPNNKDITFDLRGRNIFARGVKFYGTDTNTWRDIKINNVSIGSNILDLRNGSNTTLTNTDGVVTINSTWRPVVDNLTSNSTTSSLSANQGRILKALIDGKSDSGHNHDGRYVRYYAVTTLDCNNLAAGLTAARISATNAAHTNHSAYLYISDVGTPFQIQIPDSSIPYIYKRYYGSGGWSGWFKLNAGYADSAGSVAWANVTGKPSSYTPSAHTHAWNSLTHSSTTENQAILTNGKANGWKLQTLNIARWDNAANNAHSHANKSVLDGITSALVNSWNTAYNFVSNITGTDTDKVINKWEEIVNFLAGITEDNKLNTLLNSKLSVYELADNTNVGTIKNNGIYYSTTDASSGTLINSPFNTGFAFINMTSYDGGDDLRRSRLAFNAYGEIKVSDDRDQANTAETWYNVLTSKNSGISGSTIKLNGTSITVYSSGTADGRYVKKSGDTMLGALNFANNTWNLVGDDSYIGDCNIGGHFGIKAANTTYPGITFFNNASTFLGNLTAYGGNIKYGAYSLQFLDNGNTSVRASTWINPFSDYNSNAVADGQAICVWGQNSYLSNLSTDTGDMSLWLRRVNANLATLNMVLDGEYYAQGFQRLAHVSEIPNKDSWNYDDRYLRLTGGWMSGDINFGGDYKIFWGRNTDSASISFKNDGDGDANSYMSFVTSDNGNEYFRWSHSSGSTNTEWMALRGDGLRVRGTKVSLEGHTHDDRYYTKAESNAKYITDITTSVNKLTFTKNGSNIIRDITVNVVHSQGNLTNIPNKDATTKASPGLFIYGSYAQTIGTNPYSSVLSINTGGTIQIAGNWGDDMARNLYWRSQSDRNVADYPWKSWRTILDSENYSSTLDSRYYTESEVNSLLDAKLNRQNLSYGAWNPRGYNLAADYFYNGGDLSISESGGQIHVSIDGCFWQNEGQYRVLDTSDIGYIRDSVTVHQYLSATDPKWYPLVWGGNAHHNTSDSTGPVYKSYDKLSWQTSSQTLYATNIQTNNIKSLSIGGGIYWNPYVESATDNTDAASITLVRSGIAGGTTLVLSQQNDTNDTIQFQTNPAARLYHNNYPILTTQNTYVNNNKGYINGTEITQVNNSDTVDNRYAISTTPNTGIIYKAAIYTGFSLTSYWVRLASIPSIGVNNEFIATIHVQSGHSNPGRSAILLVYLRGGVSSLSKSFKICCNSNYDPNRFRLYYKDSDKTSEIWYQTTGRWDGIITTVISQSAEGQLYEGLTLYSGSITAVQTPSMSTYLSAQVSTITDNISGNASTATKLQTPRNIWGQSFDGTRDVSGTLSGVANIQFSADNAYNIGSNSVASRYIYTHWLGAKSGRKLELGANDSGFGQGICIDTNLNVGIGTDTPAYKLDVKGDIYSSGYVRASSGFIKGSSSNSYVLLGGGGHKLESSLNVAYSNLTGIALTGGHNNDEGYRLIFEKTMGGWTINYGVWAIAFRHSGRGTLNIGFDTTNSDGSTYIYNIRFLGSTASRESTPFRAFYNATTKVFRIYWHHYDYTSGDIAVLRGNITPHNGTWMTSLPNDVGTELAITCNMADYATNADMVDGYHATDGRIFTGDIHWGSWNDMWSDGTHTHPWYGFDHRYPNTGAYSTTISDYFGMTIKTANTLRLDCANLLINGMVQINNSNFQIRREGSSQMWVNGREGALLRETSVAGYHTLWSLKTTDGSWDFGEYNAGSEWNNIPVLSYITDSNYNSGNNAITYQIKFPLASGTVALTSNIPNPTDYYWANVKISASANTQTQPSVNTIYANNWFRSQGTSGWYSESYGGGIWMKDSSWIRTYGGKSFYCDNQIYSSNSIRMSNIILEHTDEINNSANGGIHLNYRNSGNVNLCQGGGNVGIGTTSPTQKLDVHGNIRATGQLYLPTNGNYNAILMGDDCWMGDCNINNVIGLSGTVNANSGGIKFGKGGMYIGYNGSSHYSSGTSLWTNFNADTVDGEHASNFSYTHQSSFDFSKRKSGRIVTFDQSGTDYGWINGFASTHNNYLTSVIFNSHRTSDWYVGYMEGDMSTGETNGLQAVHRLAFADGDESYPIFLGCLDLYRGGDGTISSSFPCLGYSVPFTYTRGGNYCKIVIPDTTRLSFYIIAAIASVNYSGGGMDTWTGYHRGSGAWWLHCDAIGYNEVRVKGFCQADKNNDSWWGGNPLWNNEYGANRITVCIFGHVRYK